MSTNPARLKSLRIQGFRAFGKEAQTLPIESDIAVVWGPNSQGKTSLAEAIEFLLTRKIVRREILASAQDEFADSLRNAHLPDTEQVVVSAEILDSSGHRRLVSRTLTQDYQRRQDCASQLQIDRANAAQSDLAALGVGLSEPPLSAPILTQHTLAYLFSARPQERANYFKSVLEVLDLEDFRTSVAALAGTIDQPNGTLDLLTECLAGTDFSALRSLFDTAPNIDHVRQTLMDTAESILSGAGIAVPAELPERLEAVSALRDSRENQSFPIEGFGVTAPATWTAPASSLWDDLTAYQTELSKVDADTRRLSEIFRLVLALPALSCGTTSADCPVCGTEGALTPARIQLIRDRVADTEAFRVAETKGRAALRSISQSTTTLSQSARSVRPPALARGRHWRHSQGFRASRIRTLLGPQADQVVTTWVASLSALARASGKVSRGIECVESLVGDQSTDPARPFASLKAAVERLVPLRENLTACARRALEAETALVVRLRAVIAAASATIGWAQFVRLGNDLLTLVTALRDFQARRALRAELAAAVRDIDLAKEKVLDERFAALSSSIEQWWSLLRPGEPTFFEALRQRPGARRTIDFKAGLSPHEDQSNPRVRDVVAVFSQSQLHCLGLALFLARADHEGCGFIVLDDPILSSDDEHRAHFVRTVVEKLASAPRQVIILTQCRTTWRDLEDLYSYRHIDVFQIELSDPAAGTVVSKSSDDVKSRLNAVKPLLRNNNAAIRKLAAKSLRDIAERFCKELIVNGRRASGDATAVISDYDNKTLGELEPLAQPYMTDPSHPGKMRVIRNGLNPGGHDGAVPDSGTLVTCAGDLRRFADVYL